MSSTARRLTFWVLLIIVLTILVAIINNHSNGQNKSPKKPIAADTVKYKTVLVSDKVNEIRGLQKQLTDEFTRTQESLKKMETYYQYLQGQLDIALAMKQTDSIKVKQ